MTITINRITSEQAAARQAEIRRTIGADDREIRERGNRYDFDLEDQLLAEEYSRLNLLLHGRR